MHFTCEKLEFFHVKTTQNFLKKFMEIQIFEKIKRGNLEAIGESILRDNNLLFVENKSGLTPFLYAILLGNEEIVDYLLKEYPFLSESQSSDGETPLMIAVYSKNFGIFEKLFEKFKGDNRTTFSGLSLIHIAAREGNVKALDMILKDPNLKLLINMKVDGDGPTPLHFAVANNNIGATKKLIAQKCIHINIEDDNGKTPLQIAIDEGYSEIEDIINKHAMIKNNNNTNNNNQVRSKTRKMSSDSHESMSSFASGQNVEDIKLESSDSMRNNKESDRKVTGTNLKNAFPKPVKNSVSSCIIYVVCILMIFILLIIYLNINS